MLRVLAQYGEPEVVGPPMVELLYSFTVPLYGSVIAYAIALALARPHRRAWLAQGSTMLAIVFILGVGLVGNFGHQVIGELVADATDNRQGTLEALASIAFTAAVMPYSIGRIFRLEHRHQSDEDETGLSADY